MLISLFSDTPSIFNGHLLEMDNIIMVKSGAILDKVDNLIFILWGEYFEEATAAIFATKLRQVGLCVKLVGLASQRPAGKNGLALYPDLSLRGALAVAEKAVCIILPCSAATLKHVESDPRISDFFKKATANGAQFVVPSTDLIQKSSLNKMLTSDEALSTYGLEDNLPQYAEDLAARLALQYGV